LSIQGDIYSFAFASLIDHETQEDFPDLNMDMKEVSEIYLGALLLIGVQIAMTFTITYIEAFDTTFHIIPAGSYFIIVPRFLSSVMMHLNVEPDIRSGLKLMKYAVNNPHCFKDVKQKDGSLHYRNVVAPFLLGFF
tara:strand:+ start:303 stop:710 length:408 start_codon:yes stop_codon:yes gene_type:complete